MAACVCVFNASAQDLVLDKPRIGSTSLCGDAYLAALAPDDISALSWQSRDLVSRANDAQKTLPQIWDDPEVLVTSDLTHIVFGSGEGIRSREFLGSGVQTTTLLWGEDFDTVKTNFRLLAKDLDLRPDAWLDQIDQRLASLEKPKTPPLILYLDKAGGSAGPGTFVDAVITAAGGQNIVAAPGWGKIDPETLIMLQPDLIITSFFNDGYESVNSHSIRHQLFKDFIDSHEQVDIPGSYWLCAGPGLLDVAEILNAKIQSLP